MVIQFLSQLLELCDEKNYNIGMWKQIKGFPNHWVNELGEIKNSKRNTLLKPKYNPNSGYFMVGLYFNHVYKHFYIHRLVALAFIPNPENKREVNHINGIKSDNRIENLEWVTRSENMIHGVNIGIVHNRQFNKPVILEIDNQIIEFESIKLCAEFLNVHRSTVSLYLTKRRKPTRKLKIRYKEK